MITVQSFSPEETKQYGVKLGQLLQPGNVVCLIGELGAGKTAFVSGIAKALKIDEYITSPTFTIVNEYYGTLPLYHFDAYRINQSDEMYDVGYEDYISGEGVCVIEWANQIQDILPKDYLKIHIERQAEDNENYRTISFESEGDKYINILETLDK